MRAAIIGAGPAGLALGAGLARRGHEVTLVDRDSGPGHEGPWPRRGVMQFHHAHGFRPQVAAVVSAEVPAAYAAWLAAGAEPVSVETPVGPMPVGLRSRRETFERALRTVVLAQPGVTLVRGHADRVLERAGRAAGLVVDGAELEADLVVDASGRSGRVTRSLRPEPVAGGSCGMAYVDRQYRLLPGAEPGPLLSPLAWQGDFDGYQVLVFLHEHGIFSVLVARPTDADPVLRRLREDAVFEAACRAIPALSEWTDPERSRPITATLAGGELKNAYRGQTRADGRLVLPGLLFVGDSVCTTTPIFGRGVATTMMQVAAALRLLEEHGNDLEAAGLALDAWDEEQMRPWVEDHVAMDRDTVRRWGGGDVDLAGPLPSDLVLTAAQQDPAIGQHTAAYLSMTGLPSTLDAAQPLARAVYEAGWRPAHPPGPTRDELVELVRATAA